jgi:hypothetical protein
MPRGSRVGKARTVRACPPSRRPRGHGARRARLCPPYDCCAAAWAKCTAGPASGRTRWAAKASRVVWHGLHAAVPIRRLSIAATPSRISAIGIVGFRYQNKFCRGGDKSWWPLMTRSRRRGSTWLCAGGLGVSGKRFLRRWPSPAFILRPARTRLAFVELFFQKSPPGKAT